MNVPQAHQSPCRAMQLLQLRGILGPGVLLLFCIMQFCQGAAAQEQPVIGNIKCPDHIVNLTAQAGNALLALQPETTYNLAAGMYNLTGIMSVNGRVCLVGQTRRPERVTIYSGVGSRHMQLLGGASLGVQGITFDGKEQGGGITIEAGSTLCTANADFKHNLVEDTASRPGGGAIYVPAGATAIIRKAMFWQNMAASSNGGAIWSAGTLIVSDATFASNVAGDSVMPYWKFGSSSGGAVYSKGSISVTSSTFTENSADVGGAVAVVSNTADTCAFSACSFSENVAYVSGGALYMGPVGSASYNSPTCTLQGPTTLAGNAAGLEQYYGLGGAILMRAGNLQISGSACIHSNVAGYFGGAIAVATVPGALAPYDAVSVEFQGPGDHNFGLNSAVIGTDIYVYGRDAKGQRSTNTYFSCSGQQPRLSGAYTLEGPVCAASCASGDVLYPTKCSCPAGLLFNSNYCGCGANGAKSNVQLPAVPSLSDAALDHLSSSSGLTAEQAAVGQSA